MGVLAFSPPVSAALDGVEVELAGGSAQMVGVTKFVDPEPRPAPAEPDRRAVPEGGGDACVPLTPMRLAAPFEAQEAGQ